MVLGSNRIFKKSAMDGSVTVYLGTRDFVDYFTHCDPIEGIVLLNPMAVENKNIYVGIVAIFRYGREEDEILGISFCRELYITHMQIYPRVLEPTLTPGDNSTQLGLAGGWLHEKLLKKLGAEALPFRFVLPTATPVSVVMLQGVDSTDTCGVRYYVRCYASSTPSEKPSIRSVVNLAIRKIQYAPSWRITGQPSASISKDFPLSSGKIFLEATLDKKLYYHGEEINVSVLIQNFSHKTVKHVKVSVIQIADICMVSSGKWKVTVASLDSQENCPILPGSTYHKRFDLLPHIWNIRDKYGVFTNCCSWVEDKALASSVLVSEKEIQEFFGILISYQVKVKMYIGSLNPLPGGDSSVFLPFFLMYRNPAKSQNNDVLDSEHSSPIPLINSINYKKKDNSNSDKDNYNCSEDFNVDDLAQVRVRRVPLIA